MRKVGIWIDQKEANLITLTKNAIHSKTIYSDIETRIRTEGESKQFGRFGDQYLVDEKGKDNRVKEYTQKYMLRIVKELSKADEIFLFGPAQMKMKLELWNNTHDNKENAKDNSGELKRRTKTVRRPANESVSQPATQRIRYCRRRPALVLSNRNMQKPNP